jgi:hypothetical protein
MASIGKFNATEHDTEQRDYENLPDGIYALEVTQSEVAATSKGDGTILKLRCGVIEPEEYKGRLIFGNITLENPNAQAQEIGQKQLASLCRAIGLSEIEDSEELHFQRFVGKVGLSKERKVGDKVYSPRNEVKRFYFPDADDMPEIGITAPKAANDNARGAAPANDNRPASGDARTTGNGGAAATKSRPWGKRAA